MGRGKRIGTNARFHSYDCKDKRNCEKKISYAVLKSDQRRRTESDFYRRHPELVRNYNRFD